MKIGVYQAYWGRVGGGQRYIAVVAEVLSRDHSVEVVHHCPEFDRAAIEEAMEVDLSRVAFRCLPRPERTAAAGRGPLVRLRRERELGAEISSPYDVFIDSSDCIPFFCHARRGVLLTHFPLVTFEEFHGHAHEDWMRRGWAQRLAAGAFHRLEWRRRFATYDHCIVNSDFTRGWMKRLWGLDADVLHPPRRDGFRPQPKESLVLAIGAFSNSQHKKHEALLEAFQHVARRGAAGWRLVMVGASGSSDEDRRYVDRLRAGARGFPVEIRTDVPGAELKELLERASLLWHAMGYGVDAQREPRRLEHFGMVAAEALAAGCIPVAFRGGGLPEIIVDGENGCLWSHLDELVDRSLALMSNEQQRTRLSAAALRSAERFSKQAFESRLQQVMAPALS